MPAHNVNTAALQLVLDAAKRDPARRPGTELATAIWSLEKVLKVADPNGDKIKLFDGREH